MKIVAFDMDGVLVNIDSSWQLVHRAFGTDNSLNLKRYVLGEIGYKEFMQTDIKLWGRVKEEQIEDILNKAPLMPTAGETMDELRKSGFKTAIISSGISILSERVKRMLNMDYSYANELVFDDNGWLAGVGGDVVELKRKDLVLKRLAEREGVGVTQCVTVGDSEFDTSLLMVSGFSVAFNTKDEKVQRLADLEIDDKDLRKILPWIISDKMMKANFSLKYKCVEEAKAVVDSVSPDNIKLPKGLFLKVWNQGKSVRVKVLCTRGTETMLSTLDDLLACMQVSEKVVQATASI